MTLAIFDLDNTLINGDSDHAWGDFLVSEGIVDAAEYEAANNRFYQDYLNGDLDIYRYLSFALEPLTRHEPDVLHQLRQRFVEERVRPMLLEKAFKLLEQHRRQGHYLLIITATNRFVTQPIADLLGVDDLIATEPEWQDGRYTGQVAGVPSFQAGKVTRLSAWLEQHKRTAGDAWFYSDSHNDVPLLEQVAHPVVVDPDPKLADLARERDWPIITLRD
ncbi:HAD family hydrolase [Marinobacter sp. R17]|uniref:histidinol-phosphatase n=1 Tax=Marinobacter sp. R17 TaxID=2484250 RepID=UPI000F4C10E9|nr:HAD family hydrolase [Marinobacter sp. R17]ROU00597.1 HAD family hydrolase [Marinobacter sp. R17]